MRQAAVVLGFLFTNAYLGYRHFQKSDMKHSTFKIKLANAMIEYSDSALRPNLRATGEIPLVAEKYHKLVVLQKDGVKNNGRYQRTCYYCQHDPSKPPMKDIKTSWYCAGCVGPNGETYPLCDPRTGRDCFHLHIAHGLPPKRRWTSL